MTLQNQGVFRILRISRLTGTTQTACGLSLRLLLKTPDGHIIALLQASVPGLWPRKHYLGPHSWPQIMTRK
eukprot:3378843-Heterocapsa_arctica.AAC.1